MTPLRQRMIDELTLRGLAVRTHESYLGAVFGLAKYYHRSPEQLSIEEVRAYLLHLERERHLSWNSLNVAVPGLRFLYFKTEMGTVSLAAVSVFRNQSGPASA
jgi:integrase/recombinase XerD